MTIRMQESEAAENFSRFLAHLKAGDQVQLEGDGEPLMVSRRPGRVYTWAEPGPGHIDYIEQKQREYIEKHGPIVVDEEYAEHMRKAHEELNQPLELRTSWD
ncbi:hypothetical protein [Terriglobus sp.]|uniref:hypothetical protein n=1 Tax=Terriglobus sp. TaxID=1889013 RepID=UPI003AFF7C22